MQQYKVAENQRGKGRILKAKGISNLRKRLIREGVKKELWIFSESSNGQYRFEGRMIRDPKSGFVLWNQYTIDAPARMTPSISRETGNLVFKSPKLESYRVELRKSKKVIGNVTVKSNSIPNVRKRVIADYMKDPRIVASIYTKDDKQSDTMWTEDDGNVYTHRFYNSYKEKVSPRTGEIIGGN